MLASAEPLVTILTPVYNGEVYLAECIESVLAQTYSNWEYTILNNRSTDDTKTIAERYAGSDSRIHVINEEVHLPLIANHNRAFRLVGNASKYCKIVSADDWLFPECLSSMVGLAEVHPSVGIVGSYQMSGGGQNWRDWRVRWSELPYPSTVIPGREICRRHIIDGIYVFGTPTSLLYRSDLIVGTDDFFPNPTPEADTSACYKYLQRCDFGFVHQILSYERVHDTRMTVQAHDVGAYIPSKVSDIVEYGRQFLSADEFDTCLKKSMDDYYGFLARGVVALRDSRFWNYHMDRLKTIGQPLSHFRLGKAVCWELMDLLLNPKQTLERLVKKSKRTLR